MKTKKKEKLSQHVLSIPLRRLVRGQMKQLRRTRETESELKVFLYFLQGVVPFNLTPLITSLRFTELFSMVCCLGYAWGLRRDPHRVQISLSRGRDAVPNVLKQAGLPLT